MRLPTHPPLVPRSPTPGRALLAALAAALLMELPALPAEAAGGYQTRATSPSASGRTGWITLKRELGAPSTERARRSLATLRRGARLEAWAARKFFILSGGTRREPVMGLYGPGDRMATLQRAERLVRGNQGQRRAYYVEIEVHNLGGLNEHAQSATVANQHLRAYAALVGHALDGLQAHVVMFRQGGPRFSAVVYADAHVDQDGVERAMRQAQSAIQAYARDKGLTAATYPKNADDSGAGGAGIAFGVAELGAARQGSVGAALGRVQKALAADAQAQSTARRAAARADAPATPSEGLLSWIETALHAPSRALGGGPKRRSPELRWKKLLEPAGGPETASPEIVFSGQIALRESIMLNLVGENRAKRRAALRRAFRIAGGENRDKATGLEAGENRIPTLARAVAHVREHTEDQAFYVVVDIANVGGMNKTHGKGKVNREVFRRFATILQQQLRDISDVTRLSVSGFRHGGDELSFVVVGTGLTQPAVGQAMETAQRKVDEAATDAGLMNTPHLKEHRPLGTGIYFHVAPISGDSDIPTLLDAADRALEAIKHGAYGAHASAVRAGPALPAARGAAAR